MFCHFYSLTQMAYLNDYVTFYIWAFMSLHMDDIITDETRNRSENSETVAWKINL